MKKIIFIHLLNDFLLDILGNVPQGTLLGILLFLIMINDLETDLPTCKFVDDTTLFQVCQGQQSKLQDSASQIKTWSDSNQMRLNALKTKEMVICFKKDVPI